MYFYYCTHCCVCQLDTKENDDDDDDDDDCLSVRLSVTLRVVAKRYILQKKVSE